VNFLVDTHIALWALADDERLPKAARDLIADKRNRIFASVASMWEVAIKRSIKPDRMPIGGVEFLHFCEEAGYESLPIRERHMIALESMPSIHADPFDRILVAQARAESLVFITHDDALAGYGDEVRVV
jgi:PIN domain nuclease of toxin-antitoxin system